MKIELPFLPQETHLGTIYRPVIVVGVKYLDKLVTIPFLVDSGADFSLLSREYAGAFDMPLVGGSKREVRGIHGHAVDCFERKVYLSIPGFEDAFESTVHVSNDLRLVHNLIGRDNFFVQFKVGFDQKEKKLFLDDRKA